MSDQTTSATPPHASLRVLSGPSAGSSIRLTGRVVIGRGDSADLVIDDGKLSREHIEVAPVQGAWRITDLGSRNGTSVNGDRLSGPQVLAPGDRIAIGLVEITYVHESAPPSRLRVLVGARAGTEFPLTGQRTTIGRGSEADIALDDGSASRENSAIALVDGIWRITDLDSRNGTALAGDRLPADRPTRLWAGAPLRI
nr:FHA domain-containing protein [Planctomycetota bacterium]